MNRNDRTTYMFEKDVTNTAGDEVSLLLFYTRRSLLACSSNSLFEGFEEGFVDRDKGWPRSKDDSKLFLPQNLTLLERRHIKLCRKKS